MTKQQNNPYTQYNPSKEDLLFNVPGMSVLDVEHFAQYVLITVETTDPKCICPSCKNNGTPAGRRDRTLIDIPCFGKSSRVKVRQRQFRCLNNNCEVKLFTQQAKYLFKKHKLSVRAIKWAALQLGQNNMSIRGLQREMGVGWTTIWNPVKKYLKYLTNDGKRLEGVKIIGVDEHVWHHSWTPEKGSKYLTGVFDLTKDIDGNIRARLLDLVSNRTTKVYEDWLKERPPEFIQGIQVATLDPYRGYRKALENTLDDTMVAVDPFHIVKLESKAVDEIRCRMQKEQTGHRGRKNDPLYSIRNILLVDPENITPKQAEKLKNILKTSDPNDELKVAYDSYQLLRSVYDHKVNASICYAKALRVLSDFIKSPVKEIKRLGRTLNRWKDQFLNYFKAGRVSNGGAEALNGIIELHRRIARGFTNLSNYRLRMLAACGKLFDGKNHGYKYRDSY